MKKFKIPPSPLDLLTPSDELALSVQQNTAVAELKPEDVQLFADGIALTLLHHGMAHSVQNMRLLGLQASCMIW